MGRLKMNVSVIYDSVTGNTGLLAERIRKNIADSGVLDLVRFEKVSDLKDGIPGISSPVVFVGSWTDKGTCSVKIESLLQSLQGKKKAYFGTAGFGESEEYYEKIFNRIKEIIPPGNEVLGSFFCQGKMPASVNERYKKSLEGLDKNSAEYRRFAGMIENYSKALSHPDEKDFLELDKWFKNILQKI